MEITKDILLALGFVKDPRRKTRYFYKNVSGNWSREAGIFYFHGFGHGIGFVSDLKYLLMLIDYNWQASLEPYPGNQN